MKDLLQAWLAGMNEEPEGPPSPQTQHTKMVQEALAVRLADNSPAYHALLQDPNSPVLDQSEVQEAKGLLANLAEVNPELVLSVQGKTAREARAILEKRKRDAA